MKEVCGEAKIENEGTIQTFRPSFATHLMESCVDLRYIRELLGNKSSKTTEIYTHVNNNGLSKIKSLLDRLFEKKKGV